MQAARNVVIVPYCPRNWARKLHDSFLRWLVIILHRRAGKTTAILNHHQRAATNDRWEAQRLRTLLPKITDWDLRQLMKRRVYWHVMPSYHQAKLTGAWDTVKEIGRQIPGVKFNQSEMLALYPNGSKLQLIGADKPDSLRGPGLSGLSLDEYSQIPANAFGEVLSKALADHLGYCIFSGTIKGKDQLYETHQASKDNPDWFALWQNVDISLNTEAGPTIDALRRAMEDDRKLIRQGLMTQAQFDQEWYLSPEAAIQGAYYGAQMRQLRETGHLTRVPYDPALPVDTDWDLGIDAMAIVFSQTLKSGEVRIIDYHEDIGSGLVECIKALKGQQPNPANDPKIQSANARRSQYTFGQHWAPHDIEVREISSGTTRRQTAAGHGIKFGITPKIAIEDGITAVQSFLLRCWFDEQNADGLIEALTHYRRTEQPRLQQFSPKPVHDWASHGADAMRGLAVRHRTPKDSKPKPAAAAAATGWGT